MVIALIVFCIVISAATLYSVIVYNSVVRKDVRCDEAWNAYVKLLGDRSAQVRELIAIPDVDVESDQVREVERLLAAADEVSGLDGVCEVADALSGAIVALVERLRENADVVADLRFGECTAKLADTEGKIAAARADFTASVDDYNTTLATRPASIIAGPRFRAREGGTKHEED